MENLIIVIYLALCVIGIIALVKFFQLCKDVRRIADKIDPDAKLLREQRQKEYAKESDKRQQELDDWLNFKRKK